MHRRNAKKLEDFLGFFPFCRTFTYIKVVCRFSPFRLLPLDTLEMKSFNIMFLLLDLSDARGWAQRWDRKTINGVNCLGISRWTLKVNLLPFVLLFFFLLLPLLRIVLLELRVGGTARKWSERRQRSLCRWRDGRSTNKRLPTTWEWESWFDFFFLLSLPLLLVQSTAVEIILLLKTQKSRKRRLTENESAKKKEEKMNFYSALAFPLIILGCVYLYTFAYILWATTERRRTAAKRGEEEKRRKKIDR